MTDNISRSGAVKLIVLSMVLTLAVAVPASVWATHQFLDVADSNPFHDAISAISDAGITTGFSDGGFHPSADVTRQAMAAFLERGLGRVGFESRSDQSSVALAPNFASTTITSVAIDAGATGASSNGFLMLLGTANFESSAPAQCPCPIQLDIVPAGSIVPVAAALFDLANVANDDGLSNGAATVQAVVPVQGDSSRRFVLAAILYDSSTAVTASGSLSAVYVPFGPDGDDTLAYCPAQDEPNGSAGQATPLSGSSAVGCINPLGDSDYFRVTAPGGLRLRAETTGVEGSGTCDMDTSIKIRDAANTQIAFDDDNGTGLCSSVATGVLGAGTYYVEVFGFSNATTGVYKLSVSQTASAPGTDSRAPDIGDKD
ncbi:MAG TPA: S-layer homology domain-containing protein [Aeromicrobium sp.]|nr:S-layer homology domain-containing protein [Aeromicrobium sp.]